MKITIKTDYPDGCDDFNSREITVENEGNSKTFYLQDYANENQDYTDGFLDAMKFVFGDKLNIEKLYSTDGVEDE